MLQYNIIKNSPEGGHYQQKAVIHSTFRMSLLLQSAIIISTIPEWMGWKTPESLPDSYTLQHLNAI